MHTQVVSDTAGFIALQPEWDAVLSASSVSGPFLRHGWLLAWWQAFGSGELAVVTCRDEATDELLGVLPAYRCGVGMAWPMRTLRLLGDGRCGASGLGAFATRDAEEVVIGVLAIALLDDAGPWDALELRFIDADGIFARTVAERLAVHGRAATSRVRGDLVARPCIDLPATWDEYLSTCLSHDVRSGIRRCRRRAERMGAVVETISSADELASALDEAIEIHELRMRDIVSPRFAVSAERRVFWHAMCRSLLAEDRLRLTFLVLDGRRVACECQMNFADTRYAMWGGFLGEWARSEATKTLFSFAVEDAIAEGRTTLDFGLGDMGYKSAWGVTRTWRFGTLHANRVTIRGQLARARSASATAAQGAIEAAPRTLRQPLWDLAQVARTLSRPR